jgi:hypothetical protein
MLDFQVGDFTYRARKLDTFKQMHVLKRIGPPLLKLMREEMQGTKPEDAGIDPNLVGMEKFLAALHDIADEDLDFVIMTCAAVVQRQISPNGGAPVWGPIFEPRSKTFMFEDLANLGDIMQITSNVVRDNLSGFLSIRPSESGQASPTRPTLAASNM